MYAEVCFFQGQLLDFDRCTGKFFNPRIIHFDTTGGNSCAGVAFSPSSRYMYVTRCDSLYQFDVSVPDFNSTKLVVAQFDGILDSTGLRSPWFYTMLTAPDDKIYFNGASTKALHIIHQPNEHGAACGYQKWGLELPTIHPGQLPNIPNFKLGASDPECTTSAPDLPKSEGYTIFPNPTLDYVIISNHSSSFSEPMTFQLYNLCGQLLLTETLDHLPYRIELGNFPPTGYLYRVFSLDGKRMGSGTLVKVF